MKPVFANLDSVSANWVRERVLKVPLAPWEGRVPFRALAFGIIGGSSDREDTLVHRKHRRETVLGVVRGEEGGRADPLSRYSAGVLSDGTTFEVAEIRQARHVALYLRGQQRWTLERVSYRMPQNGGLCCGIWRPCCPIYAWRVLDQGKRIGHVCHRMSTSPSRVLAFRFRDQVCLPICLTSCELEDYYELGRWSKKLMLGPPEPDDQFDDLVIPTIPLAGFSANDALVFLLNIAFRSQLAVSFRGD